MLFSEQFRKCINNETVFFEDCVLCGVKLSMCKKYGGQCRSSKCKHEWLDEETDHDRPTA